MCHEQPSSKMNKISLHSGKHEEEMRAKCYVMVTGVGK